MYVYISNGVCMSIARSHVCSSNGKIPCDELDCLFFTLIKV